MDVSDFYKILNVKKSASKEEIKHSYRNLVLKYHPDKNKSHEAPEIFRKIQIAYETLSDDTKRAKYDINTANNKLTERIMEYIRKFLMKKISEKHPYLVSAYNFLSKWLV